MRKEVKTALAMCIEGALLPPHACESEHYMSALLIMYELANEPVGLREVERAHQYRDARVLNKLGLDFDIWYNGTSIPENCAKALELYAKRYPNYTPGGKP